MGSKKRLAQILEVSAGDLTRLSVDDGNFEIFELEAQVCEFTGRTRKARWVQNPVPDLKIVLARIAKLLSRIQSPDYCHGATPGRSYRSNALAHVGARSVATFDLKEFFPSTSSKQVFRFFLKDLQCAPDVAGLLTDLCTYRRALPTGAPSSPILAYWANRGLFEAVDRRGKELKLKLSVYVDDITLSGDAIPRSLTDQMEGIVESHGHKLSGDKTRLFGPGRPKHVTGVVIAGGALRVPHTRFRKARAIRAAFDAEKDCQKRALLAAKLCGLLGEAAFLDVRYKRMAADSVRLLAAAKSKLPARSARTRVCKAKRAAASGTKRWQVAGPVPF
ncbi:reverse transcriptase family protein [Roseateles sp. LYH14W]|uniref:Reverse transcriptase family protein n=1 Tax=Pelomonas parva TaxID=3299032 RepID=A0ABW7F6B8_9BURK